jgi:hypothetical protein
LKARLSSFRNELDQTGADAAKEIFAVGFGLGESLGLVAVFEGDFLEEKIDGVFGLEALRDQFADAGGEILGVGGTEAREVVGAFVVAEFCGGQAIIGSAGFGIVQQRGEGVVPFALRAGPSLEGVVGGPDDFSGGALLQGTVIGGVVFHERLRLLPTTCVVHENSF